MRRRTPGEPAVAGPRPVFEAEVTGSVGRVRTLVVTESPLLDNEGRVAGTLGIAKDVTERKELEARLIISRRVDRKPGL